MTDVAEKTNNHSSFIQSVNGSIASIALEKTGRAVAGALVTPAIWTLNYSVNGTKPDKADLGIYATGLAGGVAVPASIVVGLFKAVADDDIAIKLNLIRKKQDAKYRPFILPCYQYSSSPPAINAMTIASFGGTVWLDENGLWVYITDATGKLVSDFEPKNAIKFYQPKSPLQKLGAGKFRWHMITKR